MSSSARVAVVGLGNAGLTLHLPALSGVAGATLAGGCDPSADRRDLVRTRFSMPVFADVDELLRETRPEVVIVATPPHLHVEHCIRALESGAHVLCEKPFASSVSEADEILAVANRVGRRVALNHEFREMPIFRAIRDRVAPADVRFAQVWQLMDLPPWKEPGWRGQMLQRTLYEAGVHLVDFLMALFAERPVAVTAVTGSSGAHPGSTDAIALVTMEFSGGRLAHVVQNRLCPGETQYFEVRAETAEASWRASFGGRARLTTGLFRSTRPHVRVEFGVAGIAWKERGASRQQVARNPKDPGMVATRAVIERTLDAFASGSEPPASGVVARDVLAVIAACYESSRTGTRVLVDQALGGPLATLAMGAPPSAR